MLRFSSLDENDMVWLTIMKMCNSTTVEFMNDLRFEYYALSTQTLNFGTLHEKIVIYIRFSQHVICFERKSYIPFK